MKIFKEKLYTVYDSTDRLKQMRDSDILAEKKKASMTGDTLRSAGVGAGLGVAAGTALGAAVGLKKGRSFVGSLKGGAKLGAVVGAASMGGIAAAKNTKKQRDINFYNRRLGYAQTQARRREAADWKKNMTQREGYTY